jgi:hypothetical protein
MSAGPQQYFLYIYSISISLIYFLGYSSDVKDGQEGIPNVNGFLSGMTNGRNIYIYIFFLIRLFCL